VNVDLALDVARAALLEVGGNMASVYIDEDDPFRDRTIATWPFDHVADKAAILGILAAEGPNFIIRCGNCVTRWATHGPCTPVRDVLRGLTCEPTP
jgi:hypothetical protein